MAGWRRGRTKLAAVLGLLKDQAAAGLARASGPFSTLQVAIVMATSHQEGLPEEKYVGVILEAGGGSRMQVSFCTRELVKRLRKTQSWVVAVKCLVIVHRAVVDGGFLFQDLLSYSSLRHGNEYLHFSPPDFTYIVDTRVLDLCIWVKSYANYLDERLRCAHALKSHLDHRWMGEVTQGRVEFLDSGVVLQQAEALQDLLHELYQCEPEGEAGDHPVVQGAMVLVVMDSYKVYDEISFRVTEMLARVDALDLSEHLALLRICKRADSQTQPLDSFLNKCKGLRLLSDLPLLDTPVVSKLEIQKLTETIQSLVNQADRRPSLTRSTSTGGGQGFMIPPLAPPLDIIAPRKPFRIDGPGNLTRTSSQPMSQVPRQVNGTRMSGRFPERVPPPYSSANLIDLSIHLVPDSSSAASVDKSRVAAATNTFRDLITF